MLSLVDNDLRFVASVSGSDIRLIKMACEQLAYTAVKHSEFKDNQCITSSQMAEIKQRIGAIGALFFPCIPYSALKQLRRCDC